MKYEDLRFEKEGETRAGEGMEMEEREKELGEKPEGREGHTGEKRVPDFLTGN